MKIGFCNYPRAPLHKEIEWIGKKGFDFVDLFLEEDQATPEKIDIKKAKRALKKYKLSAVGHTAWYLPIGSQIRQLREDAIKEAVRYFPIFRKLGAKFVTIHANWPSGMFSQKDGIAFQVESLKKLVREARKYGLKIMYEPIGTKKDNVKNVSEILTKVPGLCYHIDIGHENLCGRKPYKVIEKLHKSIVHVHLHDNDGTEDQHLPIGRGNIDWKKTIQTLKKYYDGTITLEIFAGNRNEMLQSRRKLQKLWDAA